MKNTAILVVGPSWVGDMVMAQSLLKLLQERRDGVPIDVLAPEWSLPIIARMPEVREGIALPTGHGELALGERRRLGRRLAGGHYGQAIVLPRSFKSALVPWFARIPRRTGYRGEMRYRLINDMRHLDPSRLDQTVKRFVALGLAGDESLPRIPEPALSVSVDRQRRTMERLDLAADRPVIAMMPGAEYGEAKRWPIPYFTELATMLYGAGYAVWVLGSQNDGAAGREIAGGGSAQNLCGRTGLEDAVDLLGYCEQAVTNDSGLMHVAAAVGTRVVAIYGSSTPAYTPPLTDNRVIHYLDLDCSPCFQRECPLQHLRCLREISAADVFDSIVENGRDHDHNGAINVAKSR